MRRLPNPWNSLQVKGFKNIEAYTNIPERLKPKMEFMELQL